MEAKEELKREIMAVADEWATNFIRLRIARLRKTSTEASGELIRSLEYALENGKAESEAARLLIAFNEYGRIAEMREITHDRWGRNAMTRLEAWIVKKGISRFQAGFLKTRGLKTPPKNMINQIAWGIMVNRSNGKFRRKQWYNRPKSAAVGDLYNEIAARMLDTGAEIVTKSFDFKGYAAAKGREKRK